MTQISQLPGLPPASTSPSSCSWADIPNIHMLLMEKWFFSFFFGLLTVWVWVSASSCFTWLIICPHGIQKLLHQARSETEGKHRANTGDGVRISSVPIPAPCFTWGNTCKVPPSSPQFRKSSNNLPTSKLQKPTTTCLSKRRTLWQLRMSWRLNPAPNPSGLLKRGQWRWAEPQSHWGKCRQWAGQSELLPRWADK